VHGTGDCHGCGFCLLLAGLIDLDRAAADPERDRGGARDVRPLEATPRRATLAHMDLDRSGRHVLSQAEIMLRVPYTLDGTSRRGMGPEEER
jgi:hypothetical protein